MGMVIAAVVVALVGFWLSRLSRPMVLFILRRVLSGVIVVSVASALVYWLMSRAGDPLAFTQEIQDPIARQQAQLRITEALNLDQPLPRRFINWFTGAIRGDFGASSRSEAFTITDELSRRIPITLKLVSASAVLSVVLGVAAGVVSAIRQYSGFDYLVSFFTFLFFSLPVFWVAVILKQYGGINFNDWIRDSARISPQAFVTIALVLFLIVYTSTGGTVVRKLTFAGGSAAVVVLLLLYVHLTTWVRNPGFGPFGVAVLGLLIAVGVTALVSGLRNVKARNTALTVAAVGVAGWFVLQPFFDSTAFQGTFMRGVGLTLLLALAAIAVGIGVGHAWGGYDRGVSARTGAITAFLIGVVIFVDRAMQSWQPYSESSVIRRRPIKTQYDREPRLDGDFWMHVVDTFTHLVLPTMALMLISVARYTRFTRGSMLEVLNQDYIRTARSKGLTERTVVVRHTLRNSLIPLATIVPVDLSAVIGGAVITETVFGWEGMGRMFIDGLQSLDPNRVMGFFVVVSAMAVIGNLLADLLYATLDPRIRVGS